MSLNIHIIKEELSGKREEFNAVQFNTKASLAIFEEGMDGYRERIASVFENDPILHRVPTEVVPNIGSVWLH